MVAKSPEGIGANVKIFLGHFQKCLTALIHPNPPKEQYDTAEYPLQALGHQILRA